ncbi:MAG: NADH-quinone oxidoreductase subunit N [Candidatus Sericytochromatia bacterium]|nr:NADH-quinone oxidoreductase subunit N [Candidatus Sericytochromatia bacterium]
MTTLAPLFPLFLLTGIALVAMLMSAMLRDATRVAYFSAAGLLAVLGLSVHQWSQRPEATSLFGGAVTVDGFSYFFYVLFSIIGMVVVLMALPQFESEGANRGEFYTLMLFSLLGMFVMVSSDDLMTLFLGFETMSLAIYVLVGWRRHLLRSNEAVLKYFFLGSLAAAIFLYGIALIYGSAGSVNLQSIGASLVAADSTLKLNAMFTAGVLLVLVGVAFKVAAVPFHMWAPDVYEGAPAPVTAFMATAVKAAAFALAVRLSLCFFAAEQLHAIAQFLLFNLAVLTMFVGNMFALVQRNVKRMLAYSGIAHTGYLLVGLAALPSPDAGAALLFYLVAYAFTNLGALGVVTFLGGREEGLSNVEDFAGLAWRYPLAGICMAVCMFSLIGFPLTAGFFGKYMLFAAALKANMLSLVLVAIVNSILSVYYYLRVVVTMYMQPETDAAAARPALPVATQLVLGYTTCAVVWAGLGTFNITPLLPGLSPLVGRAEASIQSLISPPIRR